MAEELLVVLNRNENSGLGFSLLQKPGLPPIIYNILDDSPAAESGEVSDSILFWSKVGILPFQFDSWINKLFQFKNKNVLFSIRVALCITDGYTVHFSCVQL